MVTNVIGSRYELVEEVAATIDVSTWRAHDCWLSQPVFVVMPEPEKDVRFQSMVSAVRGGWSPHLLHLYDLGTGSRAFAVLGVPPALLADEPFPREEEDVLLAGASLGSALGTLHTHGVVHGGIHPGAVAVGPAGEIWLSPWPLAPEPAGWSGPGGFGVDPDRQSLSAAASDVHALGAVLLSTLAGPPILSGAQATALAPELSDRAPDALRIAERAMSDSPEGGYRTAGDVEAACAAALHDQVPGAPTVPPPAGQGVTQTRRAEGRTVALVVAVVCALVVGTVAALRTPAPAREAPGRPAPAIACARSTPASTACDPLADPAGAPTRAEA